ncbi:bifunctional sulfate adenylyltransferase subunit 1/adenylylsulfate kinase [Kitasatospora sp. NPDC004799]|uniref:bifunctional sulfate adenylyltransferase subunit 1/adenylylsulfate kinase n=1 Tax=Kitasatospora sp. NPDC004799 TaxID=3154460 RepID=UPI0033A085EF
MAHQLLRVATAGSVDDGKSTLIGRLLYDSKAVFTDQLAGIERTSRERGEHAPNLALLTDGLRAEREQGITIDVAYRYFATPRRKFVLADSPGHVQYTRNMVTAASTADLALILVDARKGVLEQSRRHAFLSALLGVPHLVLCVNKMDLVDWSRDRFEEIREEFRRFTLKLDVPDLSFVPVSALHGDNIVHRSPNLPWYEGAPLLHHLEEVHVASDRNLVDARFPVQYVTRAPGGDFRGYAGTIASGVFRPGDPVVTLPSGLTSTVSAIWGPGGEPLAEAFASQAVTFRLADDLDIGRGDLLCRPGNRPHVGQDLDAVVCWFSERSVLRPGSTYTVRHTTRAAAAEVHALDYRIDVNSLHRDASSAQLSLNEIGRVRLRIRQPLMFDPYRRNRATGSFILVDDTTNDTCGVGMITGPSAPADREPSRAGGEDGGQRALPGRTLWLSGAPAPQLRDVAAALERRLAAAGHRVRLLDEETLRRGLNRDLGPDAAGRAEYARRAGEVARLLAEAGLVAVVPLPGPPPADYGELRRVHERSGISIVEIVADPSSAPEDGAGSGRPPGGRPDLRLVLRGQEPTSVATLILRQIPL